MSDRTAKRKEWVGWLRKKERIERHVKKESRKRADKRKGKASSPSQELAISDSRFRAGKRRCRCREWEEIHWWWWGWDEGTSFSSLDSQMEHHRQSKKRRSTRKCDCEYSQRPGESNFQWCSLWFNSLLFLTFQMQSLPVLFTPSSPAFHVFHSPNSLNFFVFLTMRWKNHFSWAKSK